MKMYKKALALFLSAAMVVGMITVPAKAAAPTVSTGEILIENPNDEALVKTSINKAVSAGSTVSFDVEISEAKYFAVWLLGNGEWGKEYYSGVYRNTTSTGTINVAIPADIENYSILVQYRNADGNTADTTSDKTGVYAVVKNLKVTKDNLTEGWDGSVMLTSPGTDSRVTYDCDMYVPKNGTISFDVEIGGNSPKYAVWIYEDGKEYYAYQYNNTNAVQPVSDTNAESMTHFRIIIEFRNSSGGKYTGADLSECTAKITNLKVTWETATTSLAEGGMTQLANTDGGPTQNYYIYDTIPAGSTLSFDLDFSLNEGVAVWVIGDDDWNSAASGGGEFFVYGYGEWTGERHYDVTTTKDVSNVQICVQYRGANANNTANMATIRNLKLTLANTEPEPETMTLSFVRGAVQDNADNGAHPRYLVTLNTGLTSLGNGWDKSLVVDGETKTQFNHMGYADAGAASDGTKNIYFYILYADLEADATANWTQLTKEHIVVIKAGTLVLGYPVAEDFAIKFSGNTVTQCEVPAEETVKEVELTYSTQATSTATNDGQRYNIFLDGFSDDQRTEIRGTKASIWIDGKVVTHDKMFYEQTSKSGVTLLTIPYDVLESDKTTVESLEMPHTIWLQAETMIGDYKVTKDVIVQLNGTALKLITAEPMTLKLVKGEIQDTNKRYLVTLNSGKTSVTTYSDNGLIVDDMYRSSLPATGFADKAAASDGTRDIYFYIPYSDFESQATSSWTELTKDHTVVVRAGTIVLGHMVAEDFGMSFSGNTITYFDPNQEPDLIEPEVKDAVTTSVSGTVLTLNGTGTIQASDLTGITASTITEINIEGPCKIDSQAFVGFTALQRVWFSNTVLTAAEDAFAGCASGVKAIYVIGRNVTGGLESVDGHPYYSFKILTIGSSYGEDTNNYIYTLAKEYYSTLPDRTAEDIAYDDIVVAELFTGGGTLKQRVEAIMGSPNANCFYEKWDYTGANIPTSATGPLSADNMKMALQDEYWDTVILMQSAEDSKTPATFLASTAGNGRADMDTVINFVKANNKNHSGSQYMWLQTWSYNYKLNDSNYANAIKSEENMRAGIAESMQTVVQERIDAGALDGIVPVGASIENLKTSWLNAADPNYVISWNNGTYNEGNYSNYFAIQRDTAHASIGLGRFTLGLTAFSYLAGLETKEIQTLAYECYPQNYAECEVATKLENEQSQTKAYLKYDELTKECAPQAYSAAVNALADPYHTHKICKTGDANGDDVVDARDLIRYKKAQDGSAVIVDAYTADLSIDAKVDATDLAVLRARFTE